jgi:hypothetical protein
MNELKDTYSERTKSALEEMAQSCMSEAYRKRFVVEVDAKTGDFVLSCLSTGAVVIMAENDLSETKCIELHLVTMRIVQDLLIKHIKEHAFILGEK